MWIERIPGVYEGKPMSEADQQKIARRVRISNLPLATGDSHRFSRWHPAPGTEDAYAAVQEFLAAPRHHFLSLLGNVGLGKTHLALAVAWEWLETLRGTVLYYQVEGFLDDLRQAYRSWQKDGGMDPYMLIDHAKNCGLFVLDDLGAHKPTEWAEAKLDEIIDARYISRRATVITSNLALNELPERIADRMAEGVVVTLKGKSKRREMGCKPGDSSPGRS